jgi:hypothetical protein
MWAFVVGALVLLLVPIFNFARVVRRHSAKKRAPATTTLAPVPHDFSESNLPARA